MKLRPMRWQSLASKAIANTSTRHSYVADGHRRTCYFECDNGTKTRSSALAVYAHRVIDAKRREDGVWCWVLRD
jgi:hypothetical protein